MRCAAMCSTGFDGCDFGIASLEAQGLAVVTTRQYRSCAFSQPDYVISIKEIISLEDLKSSQRHDIATQSLAFSRSDQNIDVIIHFRHHVLLGHLV
jgi:hypothetical protein